MSLYHKYRPTDFDSIIGNNDTVKSLKADLVKEDRPHVFLFHGPTGCGKTTLGRIVSNVIGCKENDFHEIDSADFRGIDTIREIRRQSHFKPLQGTCSIWLIDECHKMTNDAQNALLKALEDTPKHVYYILATTEPQKLISTIKGRCSKYPVSALSQSEMMQLLRKVVRLENESLSKPVYEQIIQDSLGYPRNALQILDQVLSVDTNSRFETAMKFAEKQSQVIELCRALVFRGGWKKIAGILSGLEKEDPEGIRRAVLGYCNSILLNEDNRRAYEIMCWFEDSTYDIGWPGITKACYAAVMPRSSDNDDIPF